MWISPTNQIGDLNCGQNTVNGYEGAVTLWGKDATDSSTNANRAVTLRPGSKLTANRAFTFPNASGEILTTAGGATITGGNISVANSAGDSAFNLGQSAKNGYIGQLGLYGKDATDATANANRRAIIKAGTKLTADRTFTFPNASGEIVTTAGSTITGNVTIAKTNAASYLTLGQSTVNGYDGILRIYGKDATDATTNANRYAELKTSDKLTANRAFWFPDYNGQIEVQALNRAESTLTGIGLTKKTLTFSTSVSSLTFSSNSWYYKVGHRVRVHVEIRITSSGDVGKGVSLYDLNALPTGYRPDITLWYGDYMSRSIAPMLQIQANGQIYVTIYGNFKAPAFDVEFDAWN